MLTLELNNQTAELLERIARETGKSQDDIVTDALELYFESILNKRADAAIAFVREKIHPLIKPSQLGRVPSKKEQEEMLGM